MPRAGKRCAVRGCDEHQPCPTHHRKREVRTKAEVRRRAVRYGPGHRATRAQWKPYVEAGQVECRRATNGTCLEDDPVIAPGQPWQLGHPDEECPAPTAPEHRRCNSATAGRPERYRA